MSHYIIKLKKKDDPTVFIARAAEIVKEGGLIAYPTDTVYGMGADPLNIQSVKRIFFIKNRESNLGLPILVANLKEAQKVGIFTDYELKLAEKFWPGAFTIIVPLKTPKNSENNKALQRKNLEINKRSSIFLDKIITGNRDEIALRVPKNKIISGICNELCRISEFGGVIGTSANFSGGSEPISGNQVVQEFQMSLNFIINTGKCKGKIPSTIVKIEHKLLNAGDSIEDAVMIIREGKISKEEIIKVLTRSN
ncbi:MAG: L-threonylcarbamoyladenylate synthase [Promethearchaeota archaeon]